MNPIERETMSELKADVRSIQEDVTDLRVDTGKFTVAIESLAALVREQIKLSAAQIEKVSKMEEKFSAFQMKIILLVIGLVAGGQGAANALKALM